MDNNYTEFQQRFKILAAKHPAWIINTLSNIFTMRLIGNKTHGDLAEIGIAEFVHQFMYDYDSRHVGKDLFRAKEHEEDIVIISEMTKQEIPISLKAYGDGPLQLSTDKEALMFPALCELGSDITDKQVIDNVFSSAAFASLDTVNVMPLIYREKSMEYNIMVFDFDKMRKETDRILYIDANQRYDFNTHQVVNGRRSHPIYMFLNQRYEYICEVRYGNASANALQRGFWTHTRHALPYFNSLTNGWITYEHNKTLVQLFRLALNSTEQGHQRANKILQADIEKLMQQSEK